MPTLGDAFLFNVDRSHLWIVISNPAGDRKPFVMVNLTTHNDRVFDESCVLEPAHYPQYIKHRTVVYYIDAKLWWIDGEKGFDELDGDGQIIPMPKVGNQTLRRIQQGALMSNFFSPDHKPRVQASLVPTTLPPRRTLPTRPPEQE
jgi:hypothetical protein